jgi:hypothetical protein
VQVRFEYSPQNLQAAHELHYRKFFPLQGKSLLWFGILLLWCGTLLILIEGKGANLFVIIPIMIFALCGIVMHLIMMRRIGKRAFKKLSKYREPFFFTIDENGFSMKYEESENYFLWNDLSKAAISDKMILLYPTDKMFFIFPKDGFSETDFDLFSSWVKTGVKLVK